MVELIYPELSYTIVGILFNVHKHLGGSFEEKYYQKAVEKLLIKQNINYSKEQNVDISFEGENIGKYFLDFLIEDKVILELKTVSLLLPIHFRQVKSYFTTKQLRLGILANFRGESLIYKRILQKQNSL